MVLVGDDNMNIPVELYEESDRRRNTSHTNHEQYDRDGFFVIKNIIDLSPLTEDVPEYRGMFDYSLGMQKEVDGKDEIATTSSNRHSRRNTPIFARSYLKVKQRLEKEIGKKLYNTYWFDRYYFNGSYLTPHVDRPACEISCSIHLGSNLETPWAFGILDGDDKQHELYLNPGDAVVYKGCERIHWRPAFPDALDESYYHNAFFHYVLQSGLRSHYAYDNGGQ